MAKGKINVKTENIFPIIKKFLYSDQEIFLRELVSNAVDATSKLKKLAARGDVSGEVGDLHIDVKIDKEANTLSIIDRGIGMTGEEVKKYINQIALSSAEEFVEKFDNITDKDIIGHFGLGFYSAFMVADKVEIITKSYQDESAVHWTCDGSPNYTLEESDKSERGTEIRLHVSEDAKEFLEDQRISTLLTKYCKFLPVEIQFGTKEVAEEMKEGEETPKMKTVPNIINNTSPTWTKTPSDLKDEDYNKFYNELYPFEQPPLFWIHLNVDYPFNLTGVLYFPQISESYEVKKNRIQLYCNQVFVTDSVEEIVPEFLTLLHGVIDSPDIPLNVSRSYLQSDSNVKKITNHISKKVADKLGELFKKDRKSFEEKWPSINLFVKYGIISDDKFYDKAKDFCLHKTVDGELLTTAELKEKIKDNQTDKNGKLVILYANSQEEQDSFISSAKKHGYEVVLMDSPIDQHYISNTEQKDSDVMYKRVDADAVSNLIEKDEENASVLSDEEQQKLVKSFEETINDQTVTVEAKALSPEDLPVFITQPEFIRRMKEMAAMGGQSYMGAMPDSHNLVVNTNHPLAGKILKSKGRKEQMIQQLYDLALLSQNKLTGNKLTQFIERSVSVMES